MTKSSLYSILKQYNLAVLATTSGDGQAQAAHTTVSAGAQPQADPTTSSARAQPQAAIIGFAVTEDLEIVFDTVRTSRKYQNLLANPRVALVIGWENETTIQYEGTAVELTATGQDSYKEVYYSVFPDGKARAASWPGLTHFKITPAWVRYSNFNDPVVVEELRF